jgi:hypothetical protein
MRRVWFAVESESGTNGSAQVRDDLFAANWNSFSDAPERGMHVRDGVPSGGSACHNLFSEVTCPRVPGWEQDWCERQLRER